MVRITELFIPKEKRFFELIDKQIVVLKKAADLLSALAKISKPDQQILQKHLDEIHLLEEEVESISHEVINSLNSAFITPIDRDEIKSLSVHICLVLTAFKNIIACLSYCHVKEWDKDFLLQVEILEESIVLLGKVFEKPLAPKRNFTTIVEINTLEKKGDSVYELALEKLFSHEHNAIEIMKRKEVYDKAEDAIDKIRILVDILETIVINNS